MTASAFTVSKRGVKREVRRAPSTKRIAWLVVVERTGECVDAGRTRGQAEVSAFDLTNALEPCVVVRVEYEWPQRAKKGDRR